jgi:two-component system LytT family response regulator
MALNVLIIDDEISSIITLRTMLQEYFTGVNIIGACDVLAEASAMIISLKPDIVFLDVEMPGGTGFDVLNTSYPNDFEVIITTAYSSHAIKAFQHNALHYILKPIDRKELGAALEKARQRITEKKKIFQQAQSVNASIGRLAVPTPEGISFINIQDIMRCTAKENYTVVNMINQERIMVSRTLREFEEVLADHHFIRVHNSYLVNLKYISKYSKSGYIVMSDESIVEVSKRRKNLFLERFSLLGKH